jgi:Flp pilus assembly protein TadG
MPITKALHRAATTLCKRHEEGAALVMFAACLVTLLALVLAAINIGRVIYFKRELQLATDACALSAAAGIPHYNSLNATEAQKNSNMVLSLIWCSPLCPW